MNTAIAYDERFYGLCESTQSSTGSRILLTDLKERKVLSLCSSDLELPSLEVDEPTKRDVMLHLQKEYSLWAQNLNDEGYFSGEHYFSGLANSHRNLAGKGSWVKIDDILENRVSASPQEKNLLENIVYCLN